MKMPWYNIENIHLYDTPALLLYQHRIAYNIQQMIESVGNSNRLRPHVKTHKMAEVVKMQMEQGIRKFKCATIAEAEMLAETAVPDILLAYQPVGPKIQRLAMLIQHFPNSRFSTLVDNKKTLEEIAKVMNANHQEIGVFLDIDNGYHRTGIAPGAAALSLYRHCQKLKGVYPRGLHVYDGHVGPSALAERQALADKDFKTVAGLIEAIGQLGGADPVIIVGGSPSFSTHTQRLQVECSPGTVLLWDWGYGNRFQEMNFQYAALVACRIISKPGTNRICLDLGHKAIAADKPIPRVHFLNLPEATHLIHSEEHLVLDVGDNQLYEIGQVLYGVPVHVCPTCSLYDEALVVRDHQIVAHWTIHARRRKISI